MDPWLCNRTGAKYQGSEHARCLTLRRVHIGQSPLIEVTLGDYFRVIDPVWVLAWSHGLNHTVHLSV